MLRLVEVRDLPPPAHFPIIYLTRSCAMCFGVHTVYVAFVVLVGGAALRRGSSELGHNSGSVEGTTPTWPLHVWGSMDWYVVQSQPGREDLARKSLEAEGLGTYLPLFQTSRVHKWQVERVVRPLFPQYLFAEARPSKIRNIRDAFGVSGLVRVALVPVRMNNSIVLELRQREIDGLIQMDEPLAAPKLTYTPGEMVKIIGGPYSGITAVFTAHTAKDRVKVLFDVFGRSSRANLSLSQIEKVQ